jgi:3-dehydroquinate dehydratase-2
VTRIIVLNGPNLSSLGSREPEIYGSGTLGDIAAAVEARAKALGVEVHFAQSNSEGDLIDLIEAERDAADGCLINPGALAHTSVALLDALRSFPGVVIEVHLSNVFAREPYRRVLVTAEAADGVISGLGPRGYEIGFDAAVELVEKKSQ